MAERERRQTPPFGGVFIAHARIMDADDMARAVRRMAHEGIERNHGLDQMVVIGLQTGGVPLAERLADALDEIDRLVPPGTHRYRLHRSQPSHRRSSGGPLERARVDRRRPMKMWTTRRKRSARCFTEAWKEQAVRHGCGLPTHSLRGARAVSL